MVIFSFTTIVISSPAVRESLTLIVSNLVVASRSAEPPSAVSSRTSVPVPPVIVMAASISAADAFTVRSTFAELAIFLLLVSVPVATFTVVAGVQTKPAPPNVRICAPASLTRNVVAPPIAPVAVISAVPAASITSILLIPPITDADAISPVVVRVSMPSPPSITSVLAKLAPPVKVSLPAPPEILSAPVPRVMISLPAPPSIVFEPAVATIISLPAPESNISAFVPRVIESLATPEVILIGVAEALPTSVTTFPAPKPAALIVTTPVPKANE